METQSPEKTKEFIKNFNMIGEAPKIFKLFDDYISSDYNVLDLGTGHGVAVRYLASKISAIGSITSIDLAVNYQNIVKELLEEEGLNEHVKFKVASVEDLPFPDSSFDLITALALFHHVENIKTAIKEIFRVLKTDGYFLMMDWNKKAKFLPHPVEDLYEPPELLSLLPTPQKTFEAKYWYFFGIQKK